MKGILNTKNNIKYKDGRQKINSQKKTNDILIKKCSNIFIIIISILFIFLLLSYDKYIINMR